MDKYYYSNNKSSSQKLKTIISDKGFIYIIKKFFYKYVFPLYLKFRKNNTFLYEGSQYNYFYHPYNLAWANDRTVELPIINRKLKSYGGKDILEIGNVLSHYLPTHWDIVDKYEKYNGVINEDVVDYKPLKKYDLVISISTLEHVGLDESPKDPEKVLKVIKNLKENCLKEGGEIIVTLPNGYNPEMDKQLFLGKLGFDNICYMKRMSWRNQWKQVTIDEIKAIKDNPPSIASNGLIIGYIK